MKRIGEVMMFFPSGSAVRRLYGGNFEGRGGKNPGPVETVASSGAKCCLP